MYEDFGPAVDGDTVTFRLFFPDKAKDAAQYDRGGLPRIRSLKIVGDFQPVGDAVPMEQVDHPLGVVWTAQVGGLEPNFYQYKFVATFENGEERRSPDPCTRHVGRNHEDSGFVIGGAVDTVRPIADRRPLNELVIYELMIDDFTAGYRAGRSPLDAIEERLDYLADLGVNAIEFMPWTAWRGTGFSWGYDPFLFFAVEDRYVADPAARADRLVRLKRLVNLLHDRGFHVIMDGVFNHVNAGSEPETGFPYSWLYQDRRDSPYIGDFARGGFFEELDYRNGCAQQFVFDVCTWWLDTFQLDGIRFDYTIGYEDPAHPARGIRGLVPALRAHLGGRDNVALMLEHLTDDRYAAIGFTNDVDASGCWDDRFFYEMGEWAGRETVDGRFVRRLDAKRDFRADKWPVVCIENHDHSTIVNRAGGRDRWWATQPAAIALATAPGAVLIHNGQEFGDDQFLPEHGDGRVAPRPLDWSLRDDEVGKRLLELYRRLFEIRREHPALAGPNVYPTHFDERRTDFDDEGYGASADRGMAIYHRWGPGTDGTVERFLVVLNFSPSDQRIDVPSPVEGRWDDLLNAGDGFDTDGFRLRDVPVGSHWGRILRHSD